MVGGIADCNGDCNVDGSQSVHLVRSFARSQIMSEPMEKCAGAGDDPKGSLVSRMPMS
jgi:hypothetical protein